MDYTNRKNTVLKKLKERKGSAIFLTTISFLIFSLILTVVLLTYLEFKTTAMYVYSCAENALDEYNSVEGTKEAASIKNGTSFSRTLDIDTYKTLFSESLGVDDSFIGKRKSGKAFTISNIKISYAVSNRLNLQVSFHLSMPFNFAGQEIKYLNKDLVVNSKYNYIP